jgi:hypothetical protein
MLKSEKELEQMLQSLENLYQKSPDQFEDLRREIINHSISSYPEKFQQRARGIQFTLDCELKKYKNPVVRMNRMVELFWETFSEFQAVVNDPTSYTAEREKSKKEGKVIPLY